VSPGHLAFVVAIVLGLAQTVLWILLFMGLANVF
jgi:hypothetical protein